MSISRVTVYCSASTKLDPKFYDLGQQLGTVLARTNRTLIYGGNAVGLMLSVADAVRANKGHVIGITPQLFVDQELHDEKADELIVVDNMRQRKALMEQHGDAFIALPGGLGTLEELSEILVGRQLGYHDKPIIILNAFDYWTPLIQMIERGIEQAFVRPSSRTLYHVSTTVEDAMRFLDNPTPAHPNATPGPAALPSAAE